MNLEYEIDPNGGLLFRGRVDSAKLLNERMAVTIGKRDHSPSRRSDRAGKEQRDYGGDRYEGYCYFGAGGNCEPDGQPHSL